MTLFTGIISLIKGMIVTFKNMITPAITIQYPKQRIPMQERYRGLADLRVDKCIACYQCAKICPTGCLKISHKEINEIDAADRNDRKKKILESFSFNMELCCFCGLCEQVCPTAAIYLNKIYEVSVYDRNEINNVNLLDPQKYAKFPDPKVK